MKKSIVVDLVAGARPNFMKVAPLYHELLRGNTTLVPRVIHTGQHYDDQLSGVFFKELGLPEPYVNLSVGSGPPAQQTGRVMEAYERLIMQARPDVTLVVGDVNSTLGCGLAAVHAGIPLVHLEAGLRSFDRTMPEEINRVLTDQISSLLLVPSEDAIANLSREGVDRDRIRFVGNIMIDALDSLRARAEATAVFDTLRLVPRRYGVVTLHRPSNVDHPEVLEPLLGALLEMSDELPLVMPAHPRLVKQLGHLSESMRDRVAQCANLRVIEPLGYVDFLALEMHSRLAVTDSGGVQEETTVLGVPCLTLRENTERPITIVEGTNRLIGTDPGAMRGAFEEILSLPMPSPSRPRLWDGQAAPRVVSALMELVAGERGLPEETRPRPLAMVGG